MFQQWSRRSLDLRFPKRRRIGPRPIGRNAASLTMFWFSLFKLLENAWYQQKAGILDQAHWLGWEILLRKYYHAEGVRRVWWPSRRHAYSPEFQKYLAGTQPPQDLSNLGEIFDGSSIESK